MDSVVHFEIPADDSKRAQSFYKKVFGWHTEEMKMPGMEYVMARTTETDEKSMAPKQPGAINGELADRKMLKNPTVTIGVSDINASLKKVEKEGGKTVMPRQSLGKDMGAIAYFKDSEGNIIGLWESPA